MRLVRFNWRLFIILVLGVAGVSAALGAAYRVQQNRLSSSYLERYDELCKQKEWKKACDMLFHYTKLQPADEQAWTKLTTTYAKIDGQEKATIRVARDALAVVQSPNLENEIYLTLAETYLKRGQFADALNIAQRSASSNDFQRIRALAKFGKTRNSALESQDRVEALQLLEKSSSDLPADIKLAITTGVTIREERPTAARRADEIVDRMVTHSANSRNALAYLERHKYRDQFGLPVIAGDLSRAIELVDMDSAQEVIDVGTVAISTEGSQAAGKRLLESLIETNPKEYEPYYWLGVDL